MRLGEPGGLLDLGVGGVGPADADVLGDRAVEQAGVLEHDGDVVPQRAERHVGDVLAVDQDAAGIGRAQALQERQRGGLAGAGRPDQRDGLAGGGLEAGVEHALVAVPEAEGDVLVADVAGHVLERLGVGLLAHAFGGVEQIEEAAQGRRVLEDAHGEARQQIELADHQAGKAHERHDLADRDLVRARPARRRPRRWRRRRRLRRCGSAPSAAPTR